MSWREASRNSRKVVQNIDPGASTMSAWRTRQDVRPSTSDIFMVRWPQNYLFCIRSWVKMTFVFFFFLQSPYWHSFARVPKELISRFVKICPTCQIRRGGTHLSPSDSGRGSPPPELGRIQSSQAAYPYMPGQKMADFEDDRRNSTSSSYDYPESRNRQWDGYNSLNSHSVNSTWSTSPSNYQYQPRPQHHHHYHNNHHHHHHGNRHHLQINPHADPDSGHNTHRNNSANSKLMSPQMDTMSSVSSSSRSENSPVQLQYMSGYSTSHPNSRYRSGCWLSVSPDNISLFCIYACTSARLEFIRKENFFEELC